jgi:hypothetical protein
VELCNWFDLIGDELSETQGKQMRDLEFFGGVSHCKQQTIAITGTTMFTINHTEQTPQQATE